MAVQVVCSVGASVVTGQVTAPTFGSAIVSAVTVTLPVLVTRNVYGTVEPTVAPDSTPACFTSVSDDVGVIVVSVESVPVTAAPVGGVAEAVAVLAT